MDSDYIINKYIVVGGEAVLEFTYDRFEEKGTLIVRLPERLTFNLHFFIQMNILIKKCLNCDDVNRITIRCPKFINYADMTKAYIINTLTYINEQSGKRFLSMMISEGVLKMRWLPRKARVSIKKQI